MQTGIVLRVTPEELREKASEAIWEIQAIEEHFNILEKLVLETGRYWKGEGGETYRKRYGVFHKLAEETVQIMKGQPVTLLQIAGIYEDTESKVMETGYVLPTNILE